MGLITETTPVIRGISCDVKACPSEYRWEPIKAWSFDPRVKALEEDAMRAGWSLRWTRSRGWYCPEHEEHAYAPGEPYARSRTIVRGREFREDGGG